MLSDYALFLLYQFVYNNLLIEYIINCVLSKWLIAAEEEGSETKLTISPDCEPLINEDSREDV